MKKKILGGSIGKDVHIAGILNFLTLAEKEGYNTIYLGGAIPLEKVVDAIQHNEPDIVALSYRLGKESLINLLNYFDKLIKKANLNKIPKLIFGGTVETGEVAREFGIFSKVFNGTEDLEEVVLWLRHGSKNKGKGFMPPQDLYERIKYKHPYPLIRHHIGLQSMEETIKNIEIISNSGLIDIVSLAPDQNAQQYFFEPEKMDENQNGAGGVPIRSAEDFKRLYNATRRGNYPLVRSYSGTRNLLKYSKLLKKTINNAWAAIPLTWYSELDKRSDRPLLQAIKENQEAIKWNAENNVPVEINEAHQWGLRYAHDAVETAMAYIAAYNAKKLGVKNYVTQYMLSTPPGMSPKMDIAKQFAKIELISELEDKNFRSIRMIRTGLLSLPTDKNAAMAQLSTVMFYGMSLKPHIVHVVAYSEASHRATSKEILESIKITKKSIYNAMLGLPNFKSDKEILSRKNELIEESLAIIDAIKSIGQNYEDPLTSPEVIYNAIKYGILDAPGLKGFSVAKGKVDTRIVNGACYSVDKNGLILKERDRLKSLKTEGKNESCSSA